jgi:hypothetical protein
MIVGIPLSSSLSNVIHTQQQGTQHTCHGGEMCLATFGSLKIDVLRVIIDPC